MDDFELDSLDDFEREMFLRCPWCAQEISVVVDVSEPDLQVVEDCEVCCRPITLHIWRTGRDIVVDAGAGG